MGNFNKIYREATSGNISPDGIVNIHERTGEEINDDAARRQAKHQWLGSTITQEHLQQIAREADSLIENAIACAVGYHGHQNHYQIISILIRVNELRKIIKNQQV